jgi:hypothetical protein
MLASIFGENKITHRMNPDEAVGFGLGWLGAIRSTKYRIPYDITLKDLITNLTAPITMNVYNEDGTLAYEKPLELFKNGDKFPTSKKVSISV